MPSKVIMVQGTTSHAGKSVFATALCRIFAQDGYSVAPFKAQNMALNSYVTPDGGEIGRSQAVQAEAAGVAPTVEMNPILLKPEGERRSQVVVMGKVTEAQSAREYYKMKPKLWPIVTSALDTLRAQYDIVVIEGAGSPAEINLKAHEIVNMRVAKYADSPVILVADIDRGGVFASLVGTMVLLESDEQALIKAFVINKFRGDPSLLDSGLEMLLERTGVPVAGVITYFKDIHIPEEDSLGLANDQKADGAQRLNVAVIRLPHIANFDDFDPLSREPLLNVRYVSSPDELDGADLVIIPGSKTTVADLAWMRERGLDSAVESSRGRGVPLIGICGGYQMLGRKILDPQRVESQLAEVEGIGLLPITTSFESVKTTHRVKAEVVEGRGILSACRGSEVAGYEIHMGQTRGDDVRIPFRITERSGTAIASDDGAIDSEGLTLGTYMHGLFHNDDLRNSIVNWMASKRGITLENNTDTLDFDAEFNKLADHIRRELDMDMLYEIVGIS